MMYGRKYYFITSVIVIVLFFSIPLYRNWFLDGILRPPINYVAQFAHQDPMERMTVRNGNSYVVYMQTVSVFTRARMSDALLLLPPDKYLKDNGVVDFDVVEPAVFYYYTGYRAVWPNSPGAEKATWVFVPRAPIVMLKRIHGKQDIDQLFELYKPYMSSL